MDMTAALPTFVITLREGVEAALVVGIVLAYLRKAGQARLNGWVWSGIAVGMAASIVIGLLFNGLISALSHSDQPYAAVVKPLLEGVFGGVAIGLLSWMLMWMVQQAQAMKGELEEAVAEALQQGRQAGWGVFGLILVAVLREGFETVIFVSTQFQQGWVAVPGAIAGLVGAVGIGFLLFQVGIKINLRQFFQGMGVLLLLIISGLVISALRHFNGAIGALVEVVPQYSALCFGQASCILGPQVWDFSQILPDRQFPGVLLKAFFGYTQKLYLVQAIAYLAFWATVGRLYLSSILGDKVLNHPVNSQSPNHN